MTCAAAFAPEPFLAAGAIGGWRRAGLEFESTPAIDVPTLAQRLRD